MEDIEVIAIDGLDNAVPQSETAVKYLHMTTIKPSQ